MIHAYLGTEYKKDADGAMELGLQQLICCVNTSTVVCLIRQGIFVLYEYALLYRDMSYVWMRKCILSNECALMTLKFHRSPFLILGHMCWERANRCGGIVTHVCMYDEQWNDPSISITKRRVRRVAFKHGHISQIRKMDIHSLAQSHRCQIWQYCNEPVHCSIEPHAY